MGCNVACWVRAKMLDPMSKQLADESPNFGVP